MAEAKRCIEVRVITHVPNPPEAYVALVFNDHTTSAFEESFPTHEMAESFAAGVRAGLDWQARLIAAECERIGEWTGGHGFPPTPTCHAVAQIIKQQFFTRWPKKP